MDFIQIRKVVFICTYECNFVTILFYTYLFLSQQEKKVYIVAVGIGSGISLDVLHQIAGDGGSVVKVDDFSKLDEMIGTIKSSTCSGTLSIK